MLEPLTDTGIAVTVVYLLSERFGFTRKSNFNDIANMKTLKVDHLSVFLIKDV